MTALVPALLLAAAYLLATSPPPGRTRLHALAALPRARDSLPAVVALGALAVLRPVLALAAGLVYLASRRLAANRAGAREVAAVSAAVPELCRAAAAELRTGAPPSVALTRAAADAPDALGAHVRRLAAAGDIGPSPPPGEWAALPGAERLRALGALWSVAAHAGSGLADGLDRLAASLAAEERRRADVAAQLAGPRASAAVLAALPLCGLALAASLGARPVPFLLTTPIGLACLVLGAALDVAGVCWVRRITRAALA